MNTRRVSELEQTRRSEALTAIGRDHGLRIFEECYVLEVVEGGWAVYYWERGERNGEAAFDTEDEACSELLLRLTADPTTRRD